MTIFQTIIIAIVEGLTEFLPVSSTGHMIIAQGILGIKSDEFVKLFTICIQFGAILSVLVLYWKRFFQSMKFYYKLLIAFIPAAVIGLLAGDFIDSLLENVWVVSIMLVIGGVFMLFADKLFNKPQEDQEITYKKSFKIGLFQCIAMIPGVSRSMATIVGGMTQKLTRKNAAEFSFFLAVPTMFAATGYKMLKAVMADGGVEMLKTNLSSLIIGNIVAFIVAMLAIKFFINFLTKYGFKAFGYYRIVAGLAIIGLMLMGFDLSVI
ncbi:MAG: undecaprenyl-diphosphate phosphatase [Bacteroidales bacterium]|nr:undecaprenyl-diphosphate phosphatase [Bacteroidales bacterium]